MNIFAKSLLVITVAAVVSGCVQHRYPTEVKNELDDAIASNPDKLPADVAAEMSVGQSVGTNSGIYAPTRRFRVQAENVDAKEFFASLLNETSYGIVVHPDVAGTISLDLQNVTIGEVLNAISSIYGYDIQQKGKIFYVYPAGVRTETFLTLPPAVYPARATTVTVTVTVIHQVHPQTAVMTAVPTNLLTVIPERV